MKLFKALWGSIYLWLIFTAAMLMVVAFFPLPRITEGGTTFLVLFIIATLGMLRAAMLVHNAAARAMRPPTLKKNQHYIEVDLHQLLDTFTIDGWAGFYEELVRRAVGDPFGLQNVTWEVVRSNSSGKVGLIVCGTPTPSVQIHGRDEILDPDDDRDLLNFR